VSLLLSSINPTDNNTSTYGAEMLQQLKETGVESMSARSEYVAIGPDGRKLTSSTGTSEWRHKDSKAKTHYSFNSAFAVVNSALYCASKFVKTIVCFGFAVFVSPLACASA
jgi:hypothetical protein